MQLRTVRKHKSPDQDDLGFENHIPKNRKKNYAKNNNKNNENLSEIVKEEGKSNHKLRNHSVVGKYKQMNSGKYPYQASAEKKPVKKAVSKTNNHIKANPLKILKHDVLTNFNKLLNKLRKKDEENLINRKRRREDLRQKPKVERKAQAQTQKFQGQIFAPPQYYYDYPYFFNPYQGMIPIPQREALEIILSSMIERGVVNNIVGAMFIKEDQDRIEMEEKNKELMEKAEKEEMKNNETNNGLNINERNNKEDNKEIKNVSNDNEKVEDNNNENKEENKENDKKNSKESEEKNIKKEQEEENKDHSLKEKEQAPQGHLEK